jgi:hypothetical protein
VVLMFYFFNRIAIVVALGLLFLGIGGFLIGENEFVPAILFSSGMGVAVVMAFAQYPIFIWRWNRLGAQKSTDGRGYFETVELVHLFMPPKTVTIRRVERPGQRPVIADLLTFTSQTQTGTKKSNTMHLDVVLRVAADCPVSAQIAPASLMMATMLEWAGIRRVTSGNSRLDNNYLVMSGEPVVVGAFFTDEAVDVLEQTIAALKDVAPTGATVHLLLFPTGVAVHLSTVSPDFAALASVDAAARALGPLADFVERR